MLKILAFLSKRENIETRAFIEYYENHHVPLICSLAPTPIVYKRNYLMRGDELNTQEDHTPDFDVVTELVFPDRAACLAWGAALGTGAPGEQVAADELSFSIRPGPGPTSSRNTRQPDEVVREVSRTGLASTRPRPGGGTGERAIAPFALYGQRTVTPEREGLLPPAS
jgi:EthD domain